MSAYTFYIKQNDRRPNLTALLKNADGTPLDLTSASAVNFIMTSGSTIKIDKVPCVIENATGGAVSYQWQADDTDTNGTYRGEFQITWTTGITQTLPEDDYIKIVVKDDLA